MLLKPLPYTNGDRLVLVRESAPLAGRPTVGVSIQELYDYREQSHAFDALVEYHQMNFDLLQRGEPDRVNVGVVSHDFFNVLGISPILGRTFAAADDALGADAVLIISYSYWQTKFGGDPAIVGQVFQMNDRPHTVVGVLPNVPHYPQENDVYMPVSACPFRAAAEKTLAQNRRNFVLTVFGRLKPGVSRDAGVAGRRCRLQPFRAREPDDLSIRIRLHGDDAAGARRADARRAADAADSARHDRPGPADCVRERRQPHARASAPPRPRARGSNRARRGACAARAPAAH